MAALTLQAHPRTPPSTTLERAARLVDPVSGIIHLVYESPMEPDAPQVFGFGSTLADTTQYGVESFGAVNGSTSIVREQAAAGAIGEAVERYACRVVPYGDLLWAPLDDLGATAVDPEATVLYDDEQHDRPGFPFRRFDAREPIGWYGACSLTTRDDRLLPAVSVFMAAVERGRRPLVQQTTNGLACGSTVEEAILSGLYEVVERDASMIAWFRGRRVPGLDVAGARDPGLVRCLELFEASSCAPVLADLTTDVGIPCVMAWARVGPEHGGFPVFATAANLSVERAARSALEELAQCLPWVRMMATRQRGRSFPPIHALSTNDDHVMWPMNPTFRHRLDVLTEHPTTHRLADHLPPPPGGDVLAEIDECVARLGAHGMEVVVADLTPPDIADVGLVVVRTVVLEAVPLYFGSGLWRLGARGRRAAPDPTVFPHPFP